MEFKNRLLELRKEKGFLQKELADLLKVRNTTVSAWENGYSQPDIDMLKTLGNLFEVTIDYLIGYEMNNEYKKTKVEEIYSNLSIVNKERWIAYGEGMLLGENKATLNENMKIEIKNKN